MPTFGDTLSDNDVRQLHAKYGPGKTLAMMNLPPDAPDAHIKAIAAAPSEAYQLSPEQYASQSPPVSADQLVKGLGAVGAGAGLGAMVAGGAPAIGEGVVGGLVGAGTKALLDKSGLTPLLNKWSNGLRENGKDPNSFSPMTESNVPDTGNGIGVATNFVHNAGSEITPRGLLANTLTAAPDVASALAGMGVSSALSPAKYIQKGILSLLGNSVPQGQNAAALQEAMSTGLPVTPQSVPKTGGELIQNLGNMRAQLEAPVAAAREAGVAAATGPFNAKQEMDQAIQTAMLKQGVLNQPVVGNQGPEVGRLKLALAGPGAEGAASLGNELTPEVSNIQDMYGAKKRFSAEAAKLRNAGNATDSKYYEEVARQLDSAMQNKMPLANQQAIAEANRPFSSFGTASDIADESFGKEADQSPAAFVKRWNLLTPDRKAEMDPRFVAAMDQLTKQSPSVLSRLSVPAWKSMLAGNGLTAPTTFSKPIPPAGIGPLLNGPAAGLAGLLGSGVTAQGNRQ